MTDLRFHALLPIMLTIIGLAYAYHLAVADAQVRIAVESGYYLSEPAYIRLRVTVQPDPANRGLTVAAVSANFETSSYEQLDGASAPRTRWRDWRDIPAGEYVVVADVDRSPQRPWRATTRFTVVGRLD